MDRTHGTERDWCRQTVCAAPRSDQACFAEACDVDEVRRALPCLGAGTPLGCRARMQQRSGVRRLKAPHSEIAATAAAGRITVPSVTARHCASKAARIKTMMQMQCAAAQQPRYDGQRDAGEGADRDRRQSRRVGRSSGLEKRFQPSGNQARHGCAQSAPSRLHRDKK